MQLWQFHHCRYHKPFFPVVAALLRRLKCSQLRKKEAVIPGRPFRAGPGIQEHRPNHRFYQFVFMDSGFAGKAPAPEWQSFSISRTLLEEFPRPVDRHGRGGPTRPLMK